MKKKKRDIQKFIKNTSFAIKMEINQERKNFYHINVQKSNFMKISVKNKPKFSVLMKNMIIVYF